MQKFHNKNTSSTPPNISSEVSGLLIILLIFISINCGAMGKNASMLTAGSAKVDITPDVKSSNIPLGGYGARRGRPATGVHDKIFARAVVFLQGTKKIAIVSTDLCFLPVCIRDNVMKKLLDRGINDIPSDHLFLCATHTHSAPDPLAMHTGNSFQMPGWSPFDAKLLEFTASRIAESIEHASSALQPVTITSGTMELHGMNHNRRGGPLTDRTLTLITMLTKEKIPLAVIVNFAAHPTLYDDKMMELSADWPGKMCSDIEQQYGKENVVMFLNGAEGDASPAGTIGSTSDEKISNYGGKMASLVSDLMSKSKPVPSPEIYAWQSIIKLPARKPNGLFLAAASQLGATIVQAREFVTKLMPQTTTLSFVRIGGILLIGFPCEPTAAIGLEAKRMARTYGVETPAIVALTNDWLGYALSAEEYHEGNYEAGMSFYGDQFGPKLLSALNETLSQHHLNTN